MIPRHAVRFFICLALLMAPWPLAAQDFPALTGRVVDAAGLLSAAEEATLAARLAALEQQSQRQLVVATIPDLQGYAIEDYGYQLGRHWGIGHKERNDGVLLIVAPNERKVRIEVGYGLEPVLTDALSALIISRDILPQFRAGNYAGGILAGAESIARQLELPPEEAQAVARSAAREAEEGMPGPSIIFWILFFTFFVLPTMTSFLGGGKSYRRGRGPVVIWGPGGGRRGGFGGGGFRGGGGSFGGGGSSGSW